MLLSSLTRSIALTLVSTALVLVAGSASALPQYTPTATARLHTDDSGQPGAEWNTQGAGTGGQISYNSTTGELTVTGVVDVTNFFDPTNGSCPTDVGSNCAFDYGVDSVGPDLDVVLAAVFSGINTVPLGGPFVRVEIEFATGVGGPDLVVTDPADGGSVQLEGEVTSGLLNGVATTGIQAAVIFNTSTQTAVFQQINSAAILEATGGPHQSLFDSGGGNMDFGLSLNTVGSFSDGLGGGLDEIVAYAYINGTLPDFTAEANGQVFRIADGNFVVPEPSTALLMGMGLLLLGRRHSSNADPGGSNRSPSRSA